MILDHFIPTNLKAKRQRFARQCLTNDVILTSNDSTAMETKGSVKLVSRGGISNQLAEGDKAVQIHPEHALTNIMGSCATLDGTSNTSGVSLANTANDICHGGTNLATDADDLLPDSTSHNKAKRKQECLDSEVAGVMNSSENNVSHKMRNKLLESGFKMDENSQSAECQERLPHVDHSISEIVD